jgi:hypothetical protein
VAVEGVHGHEVGLVQGLESVVSDACHATASPLAKSTVSAIVASARSGRGQVLWCGTQPR